MGAHVLFCAPSSAGSVAQEVGGRKKGQASHPDQRASCNWGEEGEMGWGGPAEAKAKMGGGGAK